MITINGQYGLKIEFNSPFIGGGGIFELRDNFYFAKNEF